LVKHFWETLPSWETVRGWRALPWRPHVWICKYVNWVAVDEYSNFIMLLCRCITFILSVGACGQWSPRVQNWETWTFLPISLLRITCFTR